MRDRELAAIDVDAEAIVPRALVGRRSASASHGAVVESVGEAVRTARRRPGAGLSAVR